MDLEDGRCGTHAGLESEEEGIEEKAMEKVLLTGGIEKVRFSCKIIEDISVRVLETPRGIAMFQHASASGPIIFLAATKLELVYAS